MSKMMENTIRLEEVVLFIFAIYLFIVLPYAWWWFPLLLFAPDLSMLGYVVDTKVGAITYNIVHHRGAAIGIYMIGILMSSNIVLLIGIMLFAHSTMDRIMGYGLKYQDSFKHTHLGNM